MNNYVAMNTVHKEDSGENTKLIEAVYVFNDIRDFFENDMRTTYLAVVLSKENIQKVLDEILLIFQESEDYERCSCIVEWKKKLESIKIPEC